MADQTVPVRRNAQQIATLLDSPAIRELIVKLDETRRTGRPGYPTRSMMGMALVKSLYVLPTWTRTARLVADYKGLQDVLGCSPSVYACYRFAEKLRQFDDILAACIDRVIAALRVELPEMGTTVAIDGSDLPAYANGQRYVSARSKIERKRFSDPDASWGHRSSISTRKGGGFYGYKVHATVCTTTGLPIAWEVRIAKDAEVPVVPTLLDSLTSRGFHPEHAVLDRGYDANTIYTECESRGMRPIIPLKMTPAVKAGRHLPRECEHGVWTFAGSDVKRGASKWRCPTGECSPKSEWVKADRLHPLVPRATDRFKALYHQRGAVEREFGYLKHEWALLPLRVRRIHKVKLHVDLTILGRLAVALDKVHNAPSEAAA